MKYDVILHFNLSQFIPEVKEIEDRVNDDLSGAGFEKKIQVRSELQIGHLDTSECIDTRKENELKKIFQDQFSRLLGQCTVEFKRNKSSSNSKQ